MPADGIIPVNPPLTHSRSKVSVVRHYLWITFVLTICIVSALLTSHYLLINNSLQLDEAQSLWQSSHSLGGVLHVVALDVHVPMYHLLLHFWQLYFGQAITTARIISLIFFVLTIPLVYLLGRQILSSNWALFATVLFSFSPFMNWYANVARMYTMLSFFTTISQYLFLKLIQKKKAWIAYGVSSVIGAYSHYFFSFNLAAEGIFLIFNRKHFEKGSFKKLMMVAAAVTAAMAPWLYYFIILGAAKNTRPLLPRPSSVDFFNVYSQFLFGFQDVYINTILVSCWPIVILLGFLAVRRNQRFTPEVGFIATMAFLPVVMAFTLSYIITPFFLSRYLISSVAPLLVFLVWLMSYYGRRLAWFVGLLLIVAMGFASWQQATSAQTPVNENYRGAVNYISAHATPQDIVAISTPFTIYPVEYYYHGQAAITTIPYWNRSGQGSIPSFNPKTFPSQVHKIIANHHYVFLLLSYNQGYQQTIQYYFQHHFQQVYKHTYSPGITLYEFKVGYNTVPVLGSPSTIIHSQAP